jgi:SAM-dependent methyltransferase
MPSPFSVKEPWNDVAEGYAAEAHWIMVPFSEKALELADVGEDAVIADIAAGPGTLALIAAPNVARVHALDFSESMLAALAANAKKLGLENIEIHQGDGQALPFPDGSFDAAFSMFGLMFFPDRPKGYAELYRVLKPGGVAVVSSWADVTQSSLMLIMFGALRAADPTRPEPKYDPNTLENPDLLAMEMQAAGFSDVVVHAHDHSFEAPGAEQLWDGLARSSAPLVMLKKKLGESEWARQMEKAKAFLVEKLAAAPRKLNTKGLLGVGRKPR